MDVSWRRHASRRSHGGLLFVPTLAQDGAASRASSVAALKWRSIGPANTGGRVDDLAVARVPGAPDAIYVGTASGGMFKSVNQGTSWTPVFDDVDAMMSIGDVTVAPSNPNVVWVGTGESNNRQSSSWGDGVYKSMDGGRTWKNMGLKETRHINRIVIHPDQPRRSSTSRRGRPSVGLERRARRVQDHRRRAPRGRRCCSSTTTPARTTSSSTRAIRRRSSRPPISVSARLGIQRRWPGQQHLSHQRRRRNVDEADERPADGREGTHRPRIWAADGRVVYAIVEAGRPPRGGAAERAAATPRKAACSAASIAAIPGST